MKLLSQAWRTNDLLDWTIAAIMLAVVFVALVALKFGVMRALKALPDRPGSTWKDIAMDVASATRTWLLLPVAVYVSASVLELPVRIGQIVDAGAMIGVMLQVALWINCFVGSWLERGVVRERVIDGGTVTALNLIGLAARTVVWGLALLFVLSHLGFNITALVAGLGVGGVAVALAVQNILGDLFASLSIVLDKPFVVGDFIVVDNLRGTVERIGVKTTRLRSLDGELLVFSNADLLKSRIRNFKRMADRRVEFTFNVAYETRHDALQRIPKWLREIVESQRQAKFDRAHFKQYGESALVFETVYYVLNPDHNTYMDMQQAINLAIFERFAREGVRFAYPTRSVLIRKEEVA